MVDSGGCEADSGFLGSLPATVEDMPFPQQPLPDPYMSAAVESKERSKEKWETTLRELVRNGARAIRPAVKADVVRKMAVEVAGVELEK